MSSPVGAGDDTNHHLNQEDPIQEAAISQFCAVAGCDPQTGRFLLEASGGDFDIALNTFFGTYSE